MDLDGDGIKDIVSGSWPGEIFLFRGKPDGSYGPPEKLRDKEGHIINVGGAIREDADSITITGDAGPCVADWDGDGLLDLIVGCGDGSVIFYRNSGTAREPKLDEGQILIAAGAIEYDSEKIPKTPTRGVRAKVCVVDYNGDGLPDLLVGDLSNQKPNKPAPTMFQKATATKK